VHGRHRQQCSFTDFAHGDRLEIGGVSAESQNGTPARRRQRPKFNLRFAGGAKGKCGRAWLTAGVATGCAAASQGQGRVLEWPQGAPQRAVSSI